MLINQHGRRPLFGPELCLFWLLMLDVNRIQPSGFPGFSVHKTGLFGAWFLCSLNMKRVCASDAGDYPELVQHAPFKNCFE